MPDRPATFATLFAAMLAGHQFADYIVQTDAQAAAKSRPGIEGWTALSQHVVSYHLTLAATTTLTVRLTGLPVTRRGLATGLAVSAVTHTLWDRRRPVTWVLERTGSPAFARLADRGMSGPHLGDQALHVICLWVAALTATAVGTDA